MVGEDTVRRSVQELTRVHVIRHARGKALRQREAGEVLGRTTRQVRRLIQRVRAAGDAGLVHRSRSTPSNRRHWPALKARVHQLYATHYRDWGPTLAVEKLAERQGITLSTETLRQGVRERTFHATEAPAPGVAGPGNPRGETHPTGRFAP
jgi:hypothetical protein